MAAPFKRTGAVGRWKASVSDVFDLTTGVVDRITVDGGSPSVSITATLPGREIPADTLTAFKEEMSDAELPLVESLRIEARNKSADRIGGVLLVGSREGEAGLKLEVFGHDRRDVEGAAAQIELLLQRGKRKVPKLLESTLTMIVLGFLGGAALGFFGTSGLASLPVLIGLLLIYFAILSLPYAINFLVPRLELVPEGGKTRWERLRIRVAALYGTILFPLLVTLLQKVLQLD